MQMMDVHPGSLDALCDLSPTAVCISSGGPSDNRYVRVNTAYLDLIGRSASDVVGRQLVGTAAVHDEARERRLQLLTTNGRYALEDAVIQHASGLLIPVLISAQVRVVGGKALYIEVLHDNTQRKAFESQVAKAAFNDTLTGLPNRYAFDRTLAATLTQRRSGEAIGLAYLDLNGFKAINDAHGHGVGDGLLRLFARRLRSRSKTGDFVARLAEREEIAALVAAADTMGRPEIGDMVTLGVWTGQRQNDRLAMVEHSAELVRGRRMLRQSKTGAVVAVLQSPELERRIAAARRRREAAGREDPHVVLDERQWLPWKDDHYRHTFADVRALAVAGQMIGETVEKAIERKAAPKARKGIETLWRLAPCPSLATLHDRHFRATAVVWMALGGATVPEIISVTGHTPASATTVLRHYLARHPEMADAAIGKMIEWFNKATAPDGS